MPQAADFDGSIDLWMDRLPVRALYDVLHGDPALEFMAAMEEVTDATIGELLQEQRGEVRTAIEERVQMVLQQKGEPPNDSIFEWVDPELRDEGNPVQRFVRELLQDL